MLVCCGSVFVLGLFLSGKNRWSRKTRIETTPSIKNQRTSEISCSPRLLCDVWIRKEASILLCSKMNKSSMREEFECLTNRQLYTVYAPIINSSSTIEGWITEEKTLHTDIRRSRQHVGCHWRSCRTRTVQSVRWLSSVCWYRGWAWWACCSHSPGNHRGDRIHRWSEFDSVNVSVQFAHDVLNSGTAEDRAAWRSPPVEQERTRQAIDMPRPDIRRTIHSNCTNGYANRIVPDTDYSNSNADTCNRWCRLSVCRSLNLMKCTRLD